MQLQEILDSGNYVVIDVRSDMEFAAGHAENSINIPLFMIPLKADEIMSMHQPVLLCCASGARSGQARQYLLSQGIEDCFNIGSWKEMEFYQRKKI